jgi:hypothetical protein
MQHTFEDITLAAVTDGKVSHAALPHTSSHVPV